MSINTLIKALTTLLLLLLVVAFTPLAEGEPGTWQDTVGDVVWSGIFLAGGGLLVTGTVALLRRRRDARTGRSG